MWLLHCRQSFYRWATVEARVITLQLIIIVNICRAHAMGQPCAKPSQMLPLQPWQQSFSRYNHSHFTNELIGGPGKLKNVSEITHLINEGALIQMLTGWVSQPGTFYSQTLAILQNPRDLKPMETPQVSTPSLYRFSWILNSLPLSPRKTPAQIKSLSANSGLHSPSWIWLEKNLETSLLVSL